MDLKEFLEKQNKLDNEIMLKAFNEQIDDVEVLSERLLALAVEVSELANATRCFKYWSTKKSEPKERVLDEYVDIMHFWLSIGNTLGFTADEIEKAYLKKNEENYRRQREGY